MLKLIFDTLLVAFFWYIAISTLKMENIERISVWEDQSANRRRIVLIAKAMIGVIVLIEIGYMIAPKVKFFSQVLQFFNKPIASHLIYLLVFIILFFATMQITKQVMDTERHMIKLQKKAIASANALIMAALMMILYYIESVLWGEFRAVYSSKNIYQLQYEVVLDAFLLLLPAGIILYNASRYIKLEKIRFLGFRISLPIILFVAFSKLILVKLFVVYDATIYLLRKFNLLDSKKSHDEDKLLIASAMSSGTVMAKVNAYFLASYFIVLLLLWSLQAHPNHLTNELYHNGIKIAASFSLGILLFWGIELISRKIRMVGKYARLLTIPGLIFFTITPFLEGYANLIINENTMGLKSIYHEMTTALGNSNHFFFFCIFMMQGSIAYILHIITGEAHNDRHYHSVVPIVFIVQVTLLSILYPVFLSVPPYRLLTSKTWIFFGIFVVGFIITALIGYVSYNLFTSRKSEWSRYVDSYWKVKTRVFSLVGFITLINFLPLFFVVAYPIHNRGIEFVWKKDFIAENATYTVSQMIQSKGDDTGYILTSDTNGLSHLIAFSSEAGEKKWEKIFNSTYDRYQIWDKNQVVLIKPQNIGFSIVDLKNGIIRYDYTVEQPQTLEFINIEVNNRAVLMTKNTQQLVYDQEYGELILDTLGNNFYKLIPGNQCALVKNDKVYLYQNERWEKNSDTQFLKNAEFIYYDEFGMIVFANEELFRLSADLKLKEGIVHSVVGREILETNSSRYLNHENSLTLFFEDDIRQYAYIINESDFSIRQIKLEQKIHGYHDIQNIKYTLTPGDYLFYDAYQVTLFREENLIARQWFKAQLEAQGKLMDEVFMAGEPLIFGKLVIWAEKTGELHCIRVQE